MSIANCVRIVPRDSADAARVDVLDHYRRDVIERVRHEVARAHPVHVEQSFVTYDSVLGPHERVTASAPVMDAEFIRDLHALVRHFGGERVPLLDVMDAVRRMRRLLALACDAVS